MTTSTLCFSLPYLFLLYYLPFHFLIHTFRSYFPIHVVHELCNIRTIRHPVKMNPRLSLVEQHRLIQIKTIPGL